MKGRWTCWRRGLKKINLWRTSNNCLLPCSSSAAPPQLPPAQKPGVGTPPASRRPEHRHAAPEISDIGPVQLPDIGPVQFPDMGLGPQFGPRHRGQEQGEGSRQGGIWVGGGETYDEMAWLGRPLPLTRSLTRSFPCSYSCLRLLQVRGPN